MAPQHCYPEETPIQPRSLFVPFVMVGNPRHPRPPPCPIPDAAGSADYYSNRLDNLSRTIHGSQLWLKMTPVLSRKSWPVMSVQKQSGAIFTASGSDFLHRANMSQSFWSAMSYEPCSSPATRHTLGFSDSHAITNCDFLEIGAACTLKISQMISNCNVWSILRIGTLSSWSKMKKMKNRKKDRQKWERRVLIIKQAQSKAPVPMVLTILF